MLHHPWLEHREVRGTFEMRTLLSDVLRGTTGQAANDLPTHLFGNEATVGWEGVGITRIESEHLDHLS